MAEDDESWEASFADLEVIVKYGDDKQHYRIDEEMLDRTVLQFKETMLRLGTFSFIKKKPEEVRLYLTPSAPEALQQLTAMDESEIVRTYIDALTESPVITVKE